MTKLALILHEIMVLVIIVKFAVGIPSALLAILVFSAAVQILIILTWEEK